MTYYPLEQDLDMGGNDIVNLGAMAMTGDLTLVGDINLTGDIDLTGGDWIGLGATAGRIVFEDEVIDEILFLACEVGIGTSSVPHGGVGAALLALEGQNASVNGPHVQFTTATDNYPLLQMLNWAHDDVSLWFDCYHTGVVPRSSDAGSNFLVHKTNDKLFVRSEYGVAAGAVATFDDDLVFSNTEIVVNEGGVDRNVRIEGLTDVNLLFCDAGTNGVGIGTATVPHGGVGYAKFALDGANASANGPHVQWTTVSDDYPLIQVLPWQHDNLSWFWDAYYDGAANFKSSDGGSNFAFRKLSDTLLILSEYGIAAGGAITFDDDLVFSNAEIVVNDSGVDRDFRVEGLNNTSLIRTDAATDRVGVNVAVPSSKLHVTQNDPTAGIQVLLLAQSDTDQPFIYYSGGTIYVDKTAANEYVKIETDAGIRYMRLYT